MNQIFKTIFGLLLLAICFSCDKNENSSEVYFKVTITTTVGGTVDAKTGNYLQGSQVTLTATNEAGFIFDNWSGDVSSNNPTINFIVDQPLTIKANFKETISTDPEESISKNVVLINENLIDDSGYILAIENGQNTCYLLDHFGNKIHEWTFDKALGQDVELTPDGSLLGLFKVGFSPVNFGGQSGLIQKIDRDGNILWDYMLASDNEITHHDVTQMPNGNILVLVWERIANSEAIAVGLNSTTDIFTEKVVEINPDTNSIVWEWRSWDHIVQNVNNELDNYGNPIINKNKINILYANSNVHEFVSNGDVMHANGLDYQPDLDVIALSINFFSEVWIIDHSTTTEEAKTDQGGQFNKGGDLLYRFGNKKVFGDENANHIFDFNHDPTFIDRNGQLSLMIFNNNNIAGQSRAMEFLLPTINGSTEIGTDPDVIFEFTDESLFFPRIGGAMRLPNGNTLICEGDYGYWEVTINGEVVWKYDGLGTSFWRGIFYSKNSPNIQNLGF